jgi:nucleoside 2-deoxyribosyltransferase
MTQRTPISTCSSSTRNGEALPSLVYLASPYAHSDMAIREQRFRAACRAVVSLIRAGHVVFAPVVHSHPLVEYGLSTAWTFWERIDREFLARCDEVVVLMLDGWRESEGVQAEIAVARELGKPVRYLKPANGDTPEAPTLAPVATEVTT